MNQLLRSFAWLRRAASLTILTLIQAIGLLTVVFVIVRLAPGDPAYLVAGPLAGLERIEEIREEMNLTKPLWKQYLLYLADVVRGEWGTSVFTGRAVTEDIARRLPATLELVTFSMIVAIVISVPWAAWSAANPRKVRALIGNSFGRLSGAIPEFWLALVAIWIFFTQLGWAPSPIGRLSITSTPPTRVTGFYTVDALLAGDLGLAAEAAARLVLPVFTLSIVYGAGFFRQTRVLMTQELFSGRGLYARAAGLRRRTIVRRSLRNVSPPLISLLGNSYGYMLGGAVLVESVFTWGGLGQYAVQAVETSDYFAITGTVLMASVFVLLVWRAVDIANGLIDPRTFS